LAVSASHKRKPKTSRLSTYVLNKRKRKLAPIAELPFFFVPIFVFRVFFFAFLFFLHQVYHLTMGLEHLTTHMLQFFKDFHTTISDEQ
jgi:hypothetical protein